MGNSAIAFPLQRLGMNVWTIPTVIFSNHTGYQDWQGMVMDPETIWKIYLGLKKRGVIEHCKAILTGYVGSAALEQTLEAILADIRRTHPACIYCCDPVMGDVGQGFFVHSDISQLFREKLCPQAHILTPNHFELEFLAGRALGSIEETLQACRTLLKQGPEVILVTSLRFATDKPGQITLLAVTKTEAYRVITPYFPVTLSGTGDIAAALFTFFYLQYRGSLSEALPHTAARIFEIIEATVKSGSQELALVQAQEGIAHPCHMFLGEKVG